MVGESGPRTAPAVNRPTFWPSLIRGIALIELLGVGGCVYFNAIYNANRMYDEGRKDIQSGRVASGEASLNTSIRKAERTLADNPDSRWADDALRLITRAHLLRREWREALTSAERLMAYADSREDSAEVEGYVGLAEVNLDRPARADSLLSLALEHVRDQEIRSWLLHGRGRARALLDRVEQADADFRAAVELRPHWLRPGIDRVEMFVEHGRAPEAVAAFRGLLERDFRDFEEQEVLSTAKDLAAADGAAGLQALADVEGSGLTAANRAQLVQLRGDLHLAAGDMGAARADYRAASSLAPGSAAATSAEVALLRLDFHELATVADIYQTRAQIDHVMRTRGGRANADLTRLFALFQRLTFWVESGNLGYVLAAEAARDELGAPRLARALFIRYADQQPQSAWAPKSLLAALALDDLDSGADGSWPDQPESEELRRRLREEYEDSPYLSAVTSSAATGKFRYEDLELGLQRQLERLRTLTDDRLREQATTRTSGRR